MRLLSCIRWVRTQRGREKYLSVWKSQTVYPSIISLGEKSEEPTVAGRSKSLPGSDIWLILFLCISIVFPWQNIWQRLGNMYAWSQVTLMFHNYVACRATEVGCAPDKWGAGLFPSIFVPVFMARRALPCALSQSLVQGSWFGWLHPAHYSFCHHSSRYNDWFQPEEPDGIEGTSLQFVCDIRMILSALDKLIKKPVGPDLVVFIIRAL